MFTQPLIIGSTYRLKFKSSFEQHGVCTTPGVTCLHPGGGVFRLEQITNFRDLVLAGIKLYDVFFAPLGISEQEYAKYFDGKPADELVPEYTTKEVSNETIENIADTSTSVARLKSVRTVTKHLVHVETGRSLLKKHYHDNIDYASYPIYKFVDVVDTNDVIWVPELTIAEFPEIDINEYKDMSLVVRLGYVDHPERMDPMLLAIRERMAIFGWKPKQIRMYVTGSKWMSREEYDRLKDIRVPANIVKISSTEDDKSKYMGETVIENNGFKKLVNEVKDQNTELDINTVREHDQYIDNRLFLTECKDSDIFSTGDNYFIEDTVDEMAVLRLLKEGIDYQPGDTCIAYVGASDEEKANASVVKYQLIPHYTEVAYGHNGDYDPSKLVRKFVDQQYDEVMYEDWPLDTETTDFDPANYAVRIEAGVFRGIVEGENGDYILDGDFITWNRDKIDNLFVKLSEPVERYVAATEDEIADPNTVLFHRDPDTYETVDQADVETFNGDLYVRVSGKSGPLDESRTIYHEVYSTNAALALRGFHFKFDDVFGQNKDMILQLEDIIDIAMDETNVVLPSVGSPSWSKYLDRKFRWTVQDQNDSTVITALETVVTEANMAKLAGKTGVIVGQKGAICKELYVKASNAERHNYYMLYSLLKKDDEDKVNYIAALENTIKNLNDKIADLEAEVERLTPPEGV